MIRLLRNKEIQIFLVTVGLISLLSIGIAAFFSTLTSVILILITSILFISTAIIFTYWRYREIEKLSQYLRNIGNGDYSLDVRDNSEGELSILKNDIYKMTLMLSEQQSLLKKDKILLTDAISDISHQLKTPITSMMVMSDLLSDVDLSKSKRKEFTNNIRFQLERIEWLVSSLLKLSKIDAGTISFKKEKVVVKNLIQKAVDPFLIPIDIKQQTLQISGDERISFIGDFNWSTEAIINILKNCVEHTEENGELHISFSENALYTEIVVQDNGKGIPKEDLPYIFQRFYKGKNAGDDSIGIGLAMANSIVTAQQGDIEVESTIGQGTTFRIKFFKQII
ncbi:Signal transduction histidine kinase [Salinibacillus kushneri]|uniref:histidine kinase n=1 Tax=Salinibacillus kushneri TaxID=237682 RepID=A0A1I0DVL3_9BACI|nr:Signal transduction histidine kinase [Salinibacillus kushneri]